MKQNIINVSKEYLESLCDWMLEWAEKEDQGYENGKKVTVYYKSSNPGVSCLNPGPNKWAIIFGPSTFLGIVFFAVLIIRSLRKEYPRPVKTEQA